MKIQSITSFSGSNIYVQSPQYQVDHRKLKNLSTDSFSRNISFGNNYNKIFQTLSISDFNHSSKAVAIFNELINSVKQESGISITAEGKFILNELKENGLIQTIANLSQQNPLDKYKPLILNSQNKNIPLIKIGGVELLNLENAGVYKFRHIMSDILTKPRNMTLRFADQFDKKHTLWGLSYDRDLEVQFSDNRAYNYIKYYGIAGGRQKVVEQLYGGGNPETTYYNTDGSKAFFKNWFFGGSAVPVS